jgi:hypothetical protein
MRDQTAERFRFNIFLPLNDPFRSDFEVPILIKMTLRHDYKGQHHISPLERGSPLCKLGIEAEVGPKPACFKETKPAAMAGLADRSCLWTDCFGAAFSGPIMAGPFPK